MPCPYQNNIVDNSETAMPIGVNLTSNPVRDCCLTIKLRSPLAPLRRGVQESDQSPPWGG